MSWFERFCKSVSKCWRYLDSDGNTGETRMECRITGVVMTYWASKGTLRIKSPKVKKQIFVYHAGEETLFDVMFNMDKYVQPELFYEDVEED